MASLIHLKPDKSKKGSFPQGHICFQDHFLGFSQTYPIPGVVHRAEFDASHAHNVMHIKPCVTLASPPQKNAKQLFHTEHLVIFSCLI